MSEYIVWALLGWGLSSGFMMHFWLPDPPPPPLRTYLIASVAGIIGSLIGVAIAGSNPMPGRIVMAIAGTAALVGLSQVLFGGRAEVR